MAPYTHDGTFQESIISQFSSKRGEIATGFHTQPLKEVNKTSNHNNTARYHWLKDYACAAWARATGKEKGSERRYINAAVLFDSLSNYDNYHSVLSLHLRLELKTVLKKLERSEGQRTIKLLWVCVCVCARATRHSQVMSKQLRTVGTQHGRLDYSTESF